MPFVQDATSDASASDRLWRSSQPTPEELARQTTPRPAFRPPAGPSAFDVPPTAPAPNVSLTTADARASHVSSAPIEIWEGKVLSVAKRERSMKVALSSKMGKYPDHTASIDFEWIAPQDLDLVRPGAIFYWLLYKETSHGSVRNSQELRFRRYPTWSKSQIKRMRAVAETLLSDTKPGRQLTSS